MTLKWNIEFADLYKSGGMAKLDECFRQQLKLNDEPLLWRLIEARRQPEVLDAKADAKLRSDLAVHFEQFFAQLFDMENDTPARGIWQDQIAPLYACKRLFIAARAAHALTPDEALRVNADAILNMLPFVHEEGEFFELAFAKTVMGWLENEPAHKAFLELAARYGAWALYTHEGYVRHGSGVLFKHPARLDFIDLIPVRLFGSKTVIH